jgi:hypothetical protein
MRLLLLCALISHIIMRIIRLIIYSFLSSYDFQKSSMIIINVNFYFRLKVTGNMQLTLLVNLELKCRKSTEKIVKKK